jgi:hypothetical protein
MTKTYSNFAFEEKNKPNLKLCFYWPSDKKPVCGPFSRMRGYVA